MQPTLVILAAGMGARYGGLKQLESVGSNGETMIDYAIMDACYAGFGKIVFVIRKEFEIAVKALLEKHKLAKIDVEFAFQELWDLPDPYRLPKTRKKPWGTAHAIRAARTCINEPFAVVNADDFYGRDAYCEMVKYLTKQSLNKESGIIMLGYNLGSTLSDYGTVNRGLCIVEDDILVAVEEYTDLSEKNSIVYGCNLDGVRKKVDKNATVSMNFWGFSPTIFEPLEKHFEAFLKIHLENENSEYYLPSFVNSLIENNYIECSVIKTESTWFGVTYPEDKDRVVEKIRKLTSSGLYLDRL